jgi:outer membrane protein OmpA-like peptidoglycan-associated protein
MKKIFLVFFLLTFVFGANAQHRKKDTLNICRKGSYVVFDIGGGLHTLNYKLSGYGTKNPGFGLTARAGYRYFFGKGNFGAGFDVNLKNYNSSGKFNYINEISGAVDTDNDSYTNRTYYYYLKERQSEILLNVPLGLFYQHKLLKKFKIGGGLGVVYQAVVSDRYFLKSGSLETRGFYEIYNLELYGMDQHCFYKRDYSQLKEGDNGLKNSFGAFAEFDFCYVLTPRLDLNFSFYYVHSLKNQSSKSDKYQFDPDCMSPEAYHDVYNGVLNSRVVDKVSPLAVGFTAGLRYRLQKKEKQKPPVEIKPEIPDTVPVIADVPTLQDLTPPVVKDSVPPVVEDTVPSVVIVDKPVIEENPPVIEENPPVIEEKPHVTDSVPAVDSIPSHIVVVDSPDKGIKEEISDTDLPKRTFVAINFDFNQSLIRQRDNYSAFFNDIAKLAKENPDLKIKITGHTCDIGKETTNINLGKKRAESAKRQLISRGVRADRITCETKGSAEPLYPNTSEENRAKNRRVEIKFVQ